MAMTYKSNSFMESFGKFTLAAGLAGAIGGQLIYHVATDGYEKAVNVTEATADRFGISDPCVQEMRAQDDATPLAMSSVQEQCPGTGPAELELLFQATELEDAEAFGVQIGENATKAGVGISVLSLGAIIVARRKNP